MRIFVYEFVTGGGAWNVAEMPSSLVREGEAMAARAVADFSLIADAEVVTTRDSRLPKWPSAPAVDVTSISDAAEHRTVFERLAKAADWTLVIAPETDGILLEKSRWVAAVGGRLLSPPAACVEIAGNKQTTAEWLSCHGVRVPPGFVISVENGERVASLDFPVIAKPVDGCGSQGVRLVRSAAELSIENAARSVRVEEFVPGLAASVAVLCGPAGKYALPVCEQRLSDDGRFTYLGGRLPLAAELDARAGRLALAAMAALPEPRGYLGVDMVLGDAADGSRDYVIEINPRLTTSYIGLRAASRTNLAAAMLAVYEGQPPDLCFGNEPVEFTAEGKIL